MRLTLAAALLAALSLALPGPVGPAPAEAAHLTKPAGKRHAAKKSRRKVKVAGYVRRVGGYSYAASEVYTLRADPIRQGSPFDSGFFFDSGLAVYGNQAPF